MVTKAIYKGHVLSANRMINGKVLIWGNDKELLKLGFKKDKSDTPVSYDKIVDKSELEELYHEYEYGTWKDIEFVIDGGTDENYTLWYSYSDYEKEDDIIQKCELFNFEKYDRNVYVKSVPKTEVTNYRIEKEDLLHI